MDYVSYKYSQLNIQHHMQFIQKARRLLMDDLTTFADLIREKNAVDNRIANMIGRPAQVGHAGESYRFRQRLHMEEQQGVESNIETG
jgi:hypothetical protein